jgi:hypothetical protein
MASGTRELLAPRRDVWGFLAEPNHLTDWWPGMRGVEPDRRGFSEGARWQVFTSDQGSLLGLPGRRDGGNIAPGTLVITGIVPLERWSWRLVRRGRIRPSTIDADIRLVEAAPDRTVVTITVPGRRGVAQLAVNRLYDLVQTAAAL